MCAFAIGAHARHKGLDAIEHTGHIHIEAPVKIVVGGFGHLGAHAHAGVIDQQVHSTELLLGFIGQAHPAGTVGHVVLDGMHARLVGKQCQRAFDLRVIDIADDDFHAGVVGGTGNA